MARNSCVEPWLPTIALLTFTADSRVSAAFLQLPHQSSEPTPKESTGGPFAPPSGGWTRIKTSPGRACFRGVRLKTGNGS